MVNETQGLIALGTFTTIVALIPILMNIFMKAQKKKTGTVHNFVSIR